MKIALIHNQYKLRGGTESYLFDLLNGFISAGDSVDVVVFKVDENAPHFSNGQVKTINLSFCPRTLKPVLFAHKLPAYFNKHHYDLVLSITRTASQDIAVCGGTHRGYLNSINKSAGWRDKLEIHLENNCFTTSQKIIAHSCLLQNEITDLYSINAEKIHLLYPPVNAQKFNIGAKQQCEYYRQQFALSKNKITLLFPSTGHKRKGLFILLEALQKLPTTQFELIVAGNKIPTVKELPNVKFAGFVQDMSSLYAAVDFTILPSLYEPFGLVVTESLQCGTPVIISNRVGAKDFVNEKHGIIMDEITPTAIATAVQQAAEMTFSISENFAYETGLTIEQHIQAIKQLKNNNRVFQKRVTHT